MEKLFRHFTSSFSTHYASTNARTRQGGRDRGADRPNGAGKSAALKAICGIVKPTSGEILFQGEKITGTPPYDLVERGISLAPEERHVFITMSVAENLEMGAYTLKGSHKVKGRIEKVYQLFPVLQERRRQRAGTLSSGEQQMLAMGRALMLEPKLLLLDEPSFALS